MKDGTHIIDKFQRGASPLDDEKPFEMWRQRLDKTTSGAPKHPAALKILKLYCTAEEADFLSRMPAKCPWDAIKLTRRQQRIYTPNEFNEKVLAMALERNRFADQIFYDPNRLSHRTLSVLINAFLKMPPVKQAFTVNALKSRFLRSVARLVTRDFEKTVQKEKERLAREKHNCKTK